MPEDTTSTGARFPAGFQSLPDYPAFEAFARALWNEEAAVMVGAGFSRACEREPDCPIPPIWSTFQAELEAALGYKKNTGPSALRIAQEYQTLHGNDGLDRLILRLVTDDRWTPGQLHKQLMELPWRDVLTTNWDTLLERTEPETPDRIYGCVQTIKDIGHKSRPRIVKLHGSLPSYKPFIFTEDEFRTYPTQNAPFVNLAQQVMLENELCLIGFSGKDPNFLAWSGWVRDTLGVSARRIRFVGALNLPPVSRSLLESRYVTPIDLWPLVSHLHVNQRHEMALKLFFDALAAAKPKSPFVWQMMTNEHAMLRDAPDEKRGTRKQMADVWAQERHTYPGWIVGPRKETGNRSGLFPRLQSKPETSESHLRFAMERIWRHKCAGFWLYHPDLMEADTHYEDASKELATEDRIELCVTVAAELRRFQDWNAWQIWMARLAAIDDPKAKLHFSYETAQKALLDWDDEAVLQASRSLKCKEPIWMMRRARLLANLHEHRQAAELYQAALLSIRHKLLAASKSPWLISLEGWASMFHRMSNWVLSEDPFSSPKDESDETRLRLTEAKADPWDTISRLERLASDRIHRNRRESERWVLYFEPGRYGPGGTIQDGENECPFYGLTEVIERTGAPESIAKDHVFSIRLETAFRAITERNENDLMTFLARYRGSDEKLLNWVLPRMQVARLSRRAIEKLISGIPKRIDRLLAMNDRYGGNSHLAFLLELLARVIVRVEPETALKIYRRGVKWLEGTAIWWGGYRACGKVLRAAIEPMKEVQRMEALEIALELKTPSEAVANGAGSHWPELFDGFSHDDFSSFILSAGRAARVEQLIALIGSGTSLDRDRAIRRLHFLHGAKKLTVQQQNDLEDAIWARTGDLGWPSETELPHWIFLDLPGKDRAESLFHEHTIRVVTESEVSGDMLMNLRAGLDFASRDVSKEFIVGFTRKCLAWVPIDTTRYSKISLATSGVIGENLATAHEMGKLLAWNLLPRLRLDEIPNDLTDQLIASETLEKNPYLVAIACQLARLWPDRIEQFFGAIRLAFASRDPYRVFPAFVALTQFCQDAADHKVQAEVKAILLLACEQRMQPGLSMALALLGNLIVHGALEPDEQAKLAGLLPIILEEYRYDQEALEVPSQADLPLVRQQVLRLTCRLSGDFGELRKLRDELSNDPLPEVRHGAKIELFS